MLMAIFSQTWLVPFIYLAVVLGLYLFGPQERRSELQLRVRGDLNFYLLCDIILVPLAIWATLDWRHRWIDYFTWAVMLVLLVISVRRMFAVPEPTEPDEPPPL
jgi:hypothetical protein